jgi:hypothetical protein
MILFREGEYVMQSTRHHDRLVGIRVKSKSGESSAGLHAQGTLVSSRFTSDFDENMNALVSEGMKRLSRSIG